MLKINKKIYKILFIGILFLIFNINISDASTIEFSPSFNTYNVGDNIRIKILINSSSSVNAVSSQVIYPIDKLSISSISKSGSIISLWAQEPKFSNTDGILNIEGVILNGYVGSSGNILTIIFKAKSEGQSEVKFKGASILANDGIGSETISSSNSLILNINKSQIKKEEIPVIKKPSVAENVVEKSKEVAVQVREIEKNNKLPDYSLIIVLMLVIILLLVLIISYGVYYLIKLKNYFKKKIISTQSDIFNKFKILDKDINKEDIIFEKIENNEKLNEEDIALLSDVKKDIKDTEISIMKDIEDLKDKS